MGRGRVLVVDDEPRRQETLRQFLEREGYHTEGARDGDSALGRVRSFQPDLVLTNRDVPGLPGEDLAERLLEEKIRTTLILIVGRCCRPVTARFSLAGGAAVLVKPFGLRDLLVQVRAVIRDPHKTNLHLAAQRKRSLGTP